jgi:NhaP-type Na+/H+ or K+/H+ antiporter
MEIIDSFGVYSMSATPQEIVGLLAIGIIVGMFIGFYFGVFVSALNKISKDGYEKDGKN